MSDTVGSLCTPAANEVRESRMPEIGPSGLKRAEAARSLPLRYSTFWP